MYVRGRGGREGWAKACAYEEAMDIGEKDGQLAARPEKLGELYGRDEVAAVRPSSGRSTGQMQCQQLSRGRQVVLP